MVRDRSLRQTLCLSLQPHRVCVVLEQELGVSKYCNAVSLVHLNAYFDIREEISFSCQICFLRVWVQFGIKMFPHFVATPGNVRGCSVFIHTLSSCGTLPGTTYDAFGIRMYGGNFTTLDMPDLTTSFLWGSTQVNLDSESRIELETSRPHKQNKERLRIILTAMTHMTGKAWIPLPGLLGSLNKRAVHKYHWRAAEYIWQPHTQECYSAAKVTDYSHPRYSSLL